MAQKQSVQSDHSHCASCAKLKEESCAQIKASLEECVQAHEDARIQKEQAAAKELKDTKTKVNKLQKKLSAFQLATTVGVTILGQEAFDKIFSKVEEVQNVQTKITEIVPSEDKPEKSKSIPEEPKKITSDFRSTEGVINFTDLLNQLSGLDKISEAKLQITKDQTTDTPWIPDQDGLVSGGHDPQILVDPPVAPPPSVTAISNYDFPVFLTVVPEFLQTSQYPLLGFQDSPFVFGQSNTVVPEPKYIGSVSLLGAAAYITPRRRNV